MNFDNNIKTAIINNTEISYVAFDDINSLINEINNNIEINNQRIAILNEERNILDKESEKKATPAKNYIKILKTLQNDLTLVNRNIDDISNCITNSYDLPLKEKCKDLINKLLFVVEDNSINEETKIHNIIYKNENEICELKEKNKNNINNIKLINNNIQQYLNIEIDYFNNIYNIRNKPIPNLIEMYNEIEAYRSKINYLNMANDKTLTNIIQDTQKNLNNKVRSLELLKSALIHKNIDKLCIHPITFSVYKYLIESLMSVPIKVTQEEKSDDYDYECDCYVTYKTFYYRGFIKIPFKLAIPCLLNGLYVDNIVLKDKFYFPSEIGFISKPDPELRKYMELMGFEFLRIDDKYGDKIVEINSRGHNVYFSHGYGSEKNYINRNLSCDIPKSHLELVYKIFTC
jgi:hypothetical protein